MNNYLYFLLSLIFFTHLGYSETKKDYLFEYLNVTNGLSNNTVTRVVKDDLGQFWFASSEGIVKLDAQGFDYFKPSKRYDQFYSEDVETLELGSNNLLWVGTKSGGLSSYDIAKDQFVSYNHLFKDFTRDNTFLRVTAIKETSNGYLCIGTWMSGFFVLDLETKDIVFHQPNNKVIQSIQEDNNGNVWYGSSKNLMEYNFESNKVNRHNIKATQWITKLIYDKKRDALYFGSSKGVYEFSLKTKKVKKFIGENDDQLKLINSLRLDQQGRLWVGTWKSGLFRSNPEKSIFQKIELRPHHELNKNYQGITDIFIDNNKVIWVTTTHGGVVKLIENRGFYKTASTFRDPIGFPDNNINSIFVDDYDGIWVGTKNGGIAYKKSSDQEYTPIPSSKNMVIASFTPIKDKMYVGTSEGLLILPIREPLGKSEFYGSSKFRKFKSIYFDESHQKIWFGLQQNGLAVAEYNQKLNLKEVQYFNPVNKSDAYFPADRIEHIVPDDKYNLWLGTFNGLYLFNMANKKSTFIDLKGMFDFPSNIILSLYKHPQKDILFVGSANGLLVLDIANNQIKSLGFYDQNNGLENDGINAITVDNNGIVWLGLSKGISCLNLEDGSIQNYTEEDGVDISSVNIGAVYNKKDLIYFGGQKGMVMFSPNFIANKKELPDVYFSQLFINNQYVGVDDTLNNHIVLEKALAFTKKIDLSYKDKVIRLSINTTDYIDHKNLNYLYRIKKVSDQWIDNQHTSSITLTQLPVGENVIEIKACKNGNCGKVNELIIDMSPAPWFSTTAYVIYAILFGLIIFGIFSFFIRKEKLENEVRLINLEKEKEHEVTEAKVRFFTNISHEIRTPLTLIHSPLEELLDEEDLPKKYRTKLQIINKNADNLLVLINQLLDFRKMESNKLVLSYQFISIRKLIEQKCWEFQSLVKFSGLQLNFQSKIAENQLYKLDQEKIEIVLNNLLSNAIKFTPKGKQISIELSVKDAILIKIKDQGVGIKQEDLKSIFNRYYQGEAASDKQVKGTGIGLALSKSIINLHGGDIRVKSEYGNGSEFIVELPILDAKVENETGTTIVTNDVISDKKHQLLLVDDNNDILLYLDDIFSKEYQILKAENGVEAYKLLEENPVDLIISDVMMPEMDGMEFTKKVKEHPDYQNIPILLLTANATTDSELDGLKLGANDYIRKPFNSKVIKEKVKNILAYKEQLIAFYNEQLQPIIKQEELVAEKPKKLTLDEKFIKKAVDYIEEHIDSDELNVESLASHMCMSQSTLYRKIKTLTDSTIVAFIRSVRLKKGAQLLLEEEYSVREIAERVGINDIRYFKREFEKQYGSSPTNYKESVYNNS
ncbi:response regulator [Flammeovirga yaeyamensis]|uniref:histidine kinase n=1 Tax=Flammeovirga yaeyamensis TaxID=367791 RepID=A0AAX1NBC1_9BACT|nr:ATP-binding protein [Flammeovirga yaeyamensis]MBB3699849.1 signal transduction histidine kinase/ligand-binding sensor domain-containing protein/DNA-binding response OmpR family regulator [Flammeovirga yaeyamensis]NMF38354.1 response regulator [Flammeovirga yaeyamensis]QWG04765.1 response regulator [Flammeovirga yaeyamensis]